MKYLNILFWFLASGLLITCSEDSDPGYEKANFTSIFDNNEFSSRYFPIDLQQTDDGGYLVLAKRKLREGAFMGIYLMKADEYGNFVKDISLEDQYVNPVGDLIAIGTQYYFFGMNADDQQAQLISVDSNLEGFTIAPAGGTTYPAAASADGTGVLLLSYNHIDKVSVVSRHQLDGQMTRSAKTFSIGAGDAVEEPIMNHFIGTGKKFPFKIGKVTDGLFYFNGFLNYTFSLVFTDLNKDEPLGVVQGQQENGGFSEAIPLGGNRFAASRFDFGENYFLPSVDLEMNGPTVASYLGGNVLAELVPDAPVSITKAIINTKDILIFSSDTKSKQIGLYFYDQANGAFLSSRYLGFSNPFEMAALIQTADEGIVVCGTTYLAGRFPRICLFKISKDNLADQVK